jgi:hypothetical protein
MEAFMKMNDFVLAFAEFQQIPMDVEKAKRFLAPEGMWNQLQLIKAALFQIDVSGFAPGEDLDFFQEGDR